MPKLEPEQQELNLFFNQTILPADSQEAKKLVEEAPYHPGYEGAVINTITIPANTEDTSTMNLSNGNDITLGGWSPASNMITNTDPSLNVPPYDWNNIYIGRDGELLYGDLKTSNSNDIKLGSALKFDTDKMPVNLLSTEAMMQTAAVLKFGADKYAEHNWRAGFAWSRPLAAAMRHIMAFNDGEDCDPESGLSHLAHAMCCIMFLLEFQKTHPELDDRYKVDVPKTKDTSK